MIVSENTQDTTTRGCNSYVPGTAHPVQVEERKEGLGSLSREKCKARTVVGREEGEGPPAL